MARTGDLGVCDHVAIVSSVDNNYDICKEKERLEVSKL